MKNIIYILLFLLLISNTALAIDTPENFTAIPDIDHVHLSWDSVSGAVGYNLTLPQPTIRDLNGLTPPVIDGILDTDVANYSQKGILRTPNPIDSLDYDSLYAVTDATYLYLCADTIDNDTNALDDYIGVWFDFNQDGLTADDVGYRLREDGTFTRQKWSGTAWIAFGGSGADVATGGAGTNNVVYEFRIPLSEIPIARGNYIDLVVRRTHTFGGTVQTFFPDSTADSITDPTGWQTLYFSDNINEEPLLIFNTTDTHYDINDLDSYSWYRVFLTAYDGAVYSNNTSIDFVTLDYPTYTISGYVKDNVTQLGIEGATVTVTNTFPHGFDVTDADGFYYLEGLHNDTYTVTASADTYYTNTTSVIISGSNETNQNITLTRFPSTITSGIVYDDITGEPLHNVHFYTSSETLAYSNASGYYSFETYDDNVYAHKQGYEILEIEYTVSGDTLTDQEIYLGYNNEAIPLWLFVLLSLAMVGGMYVAFSYDLEVGNFNIFSGFISAITAYANSKLIINGNVVESYEYASTIQSSMLSWLFLFISIVMTVLTMVLIIKRFKETYDEEYE